MKRRAAFAAVALAACHEQDLSKAVYVPPPEPAVRAPEGTPPAPVASAAAAEAGAGAGAGRVGAAASRGPTVGVVGAEGVAGFDRMSAEAATRLRAARVYFGHQSVGQDVLDGADAMGFHFAGVERGEDFEGGDVHLGEGLLGRNGNPHGKLKAFVDVLDHGVGRQADVAGMKFCYSDIEASTDVGALQTAYAAMVGRMTQAYPHLRLLHVTPPLRADEPVENKKRLAFGAFLAQKYGPSAVVFDLAAVESTREDGSRCTKNDVPILCDAYRSDGGHLAPAGQRRAARAFLYALSRTLG